MRTVFFVIHEFVPESGRFRFRSGTRACSAGAHHAACMVVSAGEADLANGCWFSSRGGWCGAFSYLSAALARASGGSVRLQMAHRPGSRAGRVGSVCRQVIVLWTAMGHKQCALVKLYFGMAAATMLANSIRSSACLLITSATVL